MIVKVQLCLFFFFTSIVNVAAQLTDSQEARDFCLFLLVQNKNLSMAHVPPPLSDATELQKCSSWLGHARPSVNIATKIDSR